MFNKPTEETQLDRTITQLELDLQNTDPDSKEYAKKVKLLEKLYAIRSKNAPKGVSPDTWLVVGANLLGIVIIVAYEHGHVLTSKALNQLGKMR